MAVRAFGPACNAEFFNLCLTPKNAVIKKLIFKNIEAGPFPAETDWANDIVPSIIHVATYARFRLAGFEPDDTEIRVVTMAECLGPKLALNIYKDRAFGRVEVIRAANWYVRNPNELAKISSSVPAEWNATLAAGEALEMGGQETERFEYPNKSIPEDNLDNSNDSVRRALFVLVHIARGRQESITDYKLSTIVHILCAITRRGKVADNFIDQVQEAITCDLSKSIRVSPTVCSMFYNKYCEIFESNITTLFSYMIELLPKEALRLRLLFGTNRCSGLTVLCTIGKALRTYPDFPWASISAMFPGEMDRFLTAVETVNGDVYYGLRRFLGPVASKNYSRIGWVAWKLLVRGQGEKSLNRYEGWPKRIPKEAEILNIIRDFFEAHEVVHVEEGEELMEELQVEVYRRIGSGGR